MATSNTSPRSQLQQKSFITHLTTPTVHYLNSKAASILRHGIALTNTHKEWLQPLSQLSMLLTSTISMRSKDGDIFSSMPQLRTHLYVITPLQREKHALRLGRSVFQVLTSAFVFVSC